MYPAHIYSYPPSSTYSVPHAQYQQHHTNQQVHPNGQFDNYQPQTVGYVPQQILSSYYQPPGLKQEPREQVLHSRLQSTELRSPVGQSAANHIVPNDAANVRGPWLKDGTTSSHHLLSSKHTISCHENSHRYPDALKPTYVPSNLVSAVTTNHALSCPITVSPQASTNGRKEEKPSFPHAARPVLKSAQLKAPGGVSDSESPYQELDEKGVAEMLGLTDFISFHHPDTTTVKSEPSYDIAVPPQKAAKSKHFDNPTLPTDPHEQHLTKPSNGQQSSPTGAKCPDDSDIGVQFTYLCGNCTFKSAFKQNCRRHINTVHAGEQVAIKSKSLYLCKRVPNCPFSSAFKQNCRRHINTAH